MKNTIPFLSKEFVKENERLFETEHLKKLADKLLFLSINGINASQILPFFQEEITLPIISSYQYFSEGMNIWNNEIGKEKELVSTFKEAIEQAGIRHLLILLGQRITPGSITDSRAIPPLKNTLLASCTNIFHNKLTVAGREWTKHTNRSHDKFWGVIEGGELEKNRKALNCIENIVDNHTWWNVFFHYKHKVVFECRLPSGHGARWGKDGTEFIGFLEPFLND